jgi:hypothetical protein
MQQRQLVGVRGKILVRLPPILNIGNRQKGVGAFLCQIEKHLGRAEKGRDEIPAVRFERGAYFDPVRGPNWWEYFFERVSDIDPMLFPVHSIAELTELSTSFAMRIILRRRAAANLIRKHIVIRPEMVRGVDE